MVIGRGLATFPAGAVRAEAVPTPEKADQLLPKQLRLILKSVISIAALIWAFHDLDISELAGIGGSTDWILMLVAAMLSIASVGALALRWREILQPLASSRVSTLLRGHYIGLFGNNAFPLRAGEFMRADYVRRKLDKPFISILGTIFLERSIDLLVVGILFVGLATTVSIPGIPPVYESAMIGGLVLVAATVTVLARFRRQVGRFIVRRFPGATESRKLIRDLLTRRGLSALLLTSALVWLLYAIRFQAVVSSIGLPIEPGLVVLLLVATAAGFMIPAAPGALGTYHMAVVFSMHDIYGVELVDAQAAAILLHLSAYIPSTLIGVVVFMTSSHDPEENMSRSHA